MKLSIHPPKTDLLLVVDDARLSQSIARAIGCRGWTYERASRLQNASEWLRHTEFSVVVVDLDVSGLEQLDWQQEVLARPSPPRIVLLAAAERTTQAVVAVDQGATAFLPKPVSIEALLTQIDCCQRRVQASGDASDLQRRLEERIAAQDLQRSQMLVDVMQLLSAASCYRDHETGTHNQRVGMVSSLLARTIGWTNADADDLQLAALMHDIGKLAIPDVILRKPGKLTDGEYRIIQRHTILGDEMLAQSKLPLLQLSRQIALSHHERWDGTGYPQQVAGNDIPEAARIVSIADVYDALTHDRVYRPAMSEGKALNIMSDGCGTQFDPEVLDAFLGIHQLVAHVNETLVEEPTDSTSDLWCASDAQVLAL